MSKIQQMVKEFESRASLLDFSNLQKLEPVKQIQRTDEWFALRRFKFTSSSVYKLLTNPRSAEAKKNGELSETAKTYILEKVTEEIGGELPEFKSQATEWGEKHEDDAAKAYQLKTGNPIEEVGFVQYTEFFGGSPDRTVIDQVMTENHLGGLEIKCPFNSVNHTKHLLLGSQDDLKENHPDYYWQCMSHIITLNVNWCDFVSYDPRVSEPLRLFVLRVWRNHEDVDLLLDRIESALDYKKKIKAQLKIC